MHYRIILTIGVLYVKDKICLMSPFVTKLFFIQIKIF